MLPLFPSFSFSSLLLSHIHRSLSSFPPRLSQGPWHRWRPWGRRTTVCAVSWMPTGTRWSCWSRSRLKLILCALRKTWRANNSSASYNKRCRACKRYSHSARSLSNTCTHTPHFVLKLRYKSAGRDLNLSQMRDINKPDTPEGFISCNKIERLVITALCWSSFLLRVQNTKRRLS